MARKPPLHSVNELLGPGLEHTLGDLDPPAADGALVALARVLALTLDRMSADERRTMLGQTAPLYLKTLVELDSRAARREKPARESGPPRLEHLRQEHARRRPAGA